MEARMSRRSGARASAATSMVLGCLLPMKHSIDDSALMNAKDVQFSLLNKIWKDDLQNKSPMKP